MMLFDYKNKLVSFLYRIFNTEVSWWYPRCVCEGGAGVTLAACVCEGGWYPRCVCEGELVVPSLRV